MTVQSLSTHAAMVHKETLANTIATVVIAALLSWLIFHGQSSIEPLAPPVGGVLGILPGTFNFTLLVTLALTLITRGRVRRGVYRTLATGELSRWNARLPASLPVRALAAALLASMAFIPLTLAVLWLLMHARLIPDHWSFAGMLGFFVVYFAALSWVVTPAVIWRALAD